MLYWLFPLLVAGSEPLPTVSRDTFRPGSSWAWRYVEKNTGRTHAIEKYTTVSSENGIVVLEMSTQYDGAGEYFVHHRIRASVDRCLKAYQNPARTQPWSIELFYKDNQGRWESAGNPGKTLAFEEKFNCRPHAYAGSNKMALEWDANGRFRFFDKIKKRAGSWFFPSGELAGIAARKEFSGYTFEFEPGL